MWVKACLLALAGLACASASVFAQEPATAAASSGQKLKAAGPPLPPVPPPALNFRQLLSMNSAEREKVFATRSESQRQILQQKLREYESLPPLEREARLCSLDLRLYLRPLMEAPASNRVEQLELVPQPSRKLVGERLHFWDQLAPAVQSDFLTNEWILRYLFRPERPAGADPKPTPALREKLEKGMESWNQLPEQKRQEILANFRLIFEVSDKEKAKILNEFSDTERAHMQRALLTFERLPKGKRERCVNGFEKFAVLSAEERQQFLTNVELWRGMSAQDRLTWRSLVSRMASPKPPSPTGLNTPPPVPSLHRRSLGLAQTNN